MLDFGTEGEEWASIDNDPPLTLRKDKCIFVALETLGSGLTVFLLVFREPFAHRSNRFLACLLRSVPQETTNQKTRASRAKNNQQDRGMMGGALFSASCLGLCDQRTVGSDSGKGSMFKWPLKQDAKVDADGNIFFPPLGFLRGGSRFFLKGFGECQSFGMPGCTFSSGGAAAWSWQVQVCATLDLSPWESIQKGSPSGRYSQKECQRKHFGNIPKIVNLVADGCV